MKPDYLRLKEIRGNLIIVEGVRGVGYDELVEIRHGKQPAVGRVVELAGDVAVVLVFEGTQWLSLAHTVTRFAGRAMAMPLSIELPGRIFDGLGRPLDGLGSVTAAATRGINGTPLNAAHRQPPHTPMQTGFSAIDGLCTLLRGQKLPIFSGDGLPHDALAAQIAAQFLTANENSVVVFAAMGIKQDTAQFFRRQFEESGVIDRTVLYLNLANDPPAERIITPRMALTAAEFLAFDHGRDVLVLLTDMTAYAEALREMAAARGEIPGRRGYPGYLYSDLASLYERAAVRRAQPGALTLLPILTMPADDSTHPVADLTGYITEGQIVLSRELHAQGIFPPIAVLPSLSRLMKDGIGAGKTQPNHAALAQKLFAAYAQVPDVRAIRTIVGEGDLSEADKKILAFGQQFEGAFIHQQVGEVRGFGETLALAERLLSF